MPNVVHILRGQTVIINRRKRARVISHPVQEPTTGKWYGEARFNGRIIRVYRATANCWIPVGDFTKGTDGTRGIAESANLVSGNGRRS